MWEFREEYTLKKFFHKGEVVDHGDRLASY